MKIRKATAKNMKEVFKLLHEYTEYEHKLDKNVRLESLKKIEKEESEHFKGGTIYFIAEDNGKIVGCLN